MEERTKMAAISCLLEAQDRKCKRDRERERGRNNYPLSAPEGMLKFWAGHGGVLTPHNYCKSHDNSTGGE